VRWFCSCSVRSHLEAWEQIVCYIVSLLCECSCALGLSRACLRGLVGVRTLCVYFDLPKEASLVFWLQVVHRKLAIVEKLVAVVINHNQ